MSIHIRALVRAAVVLAGILVSCPVFAVTVTWNGSVDNSWNNPNNWSTNSLPTSSDDVVIANAGSGTATVDTIATVKSITIQSGATLRIDGGQTLIITNTSTVNAGGTLNLVGANPTGGILNGSGNLIVNGTAGIHGNCTIGGSGNVTVNSGGSLEIGSTGGASVITVSRNITNNNGGTVTLLSTSAVGFKFGGHLSNSGLVDIASDHNIDADTGSPFISNTAATAMIKKSAGGGTAAINIPVNNGSGATVEVDSGTLQLNDGGVVHSNYVISAGTTLHFSGTFTGGGSPSLTIGTGGTFDAGTGVNVTFTDVTLSGGTITGAGAVSVTGNFYWSGGTISGTGTKVLTSTSVPTISCSSSDCNLNGATLQLQAYTIYSASSNALRFSNGASLILDTGVGIRVTNDGDFRNGGGAASSISIAWGAFPNAASIWKTDTSGISDIEVPVTLNGSFNVDAGTLRIAADVTVNAGAILDYDPGTTIEVSSGLFLFAGGPVGVPLYGDFKITGGTVRVPAPLSITLLNVTLQSGVIDGGGTLVLFGTTTWSGGTMGSAAAPGGGTRINSPPDTLNITAGGAQSLTQGREIINAGTVNYAGTTSNPLTMSANAKITNNNVFNLTADGTINLSGSALIDNFGTITKTAGTGTSTISPPVDNHSGHTVSVSTGTLALAGGGTDQGIFTIASGTTLALTGGTVNLSGSPTVTGSGTLSVAGATIDAAMGVDVTCPNVALSSGAISGAGTVRVSGNFNWSGGTIGGSGSRYLNSGSTPTISCSSSCTLDTATLYLQGDTTFSAGSNALQFSNGASLNIGAGKKLSITNDGDVTGSGSISNDGTIWKKTTAGTSTIGVPVTLYGTSIVDLDAGTLKFAGGGSVDASASATLDIGAGTTLDVSGGVFLFNSGSVSTPGSGTFQISGGAVRVPASVTVTLPNVTLQTGGVVDGAGTLILSGTSTWSGGAMGSATAAGGITQINSGNTLNISAGGAQSLTQSRELLNNGTVNYAGTTSSPLTISANGKITNSNALNLTAGSGNINLSGSALIENDGTITKTTGPGTTTISPPLDNKFGGIVSVSAGTLSLSGGGTERGAFIVASGATLAFSGGLFTMLGTPSVAGPGALSISGTTIDIGDGPGGSTDTFASTAPTTFASGTINVKDATLSMPAAFSVSGTIEHYGGTISGSPMTINSGGVLNCRGTQSPASIAINTTVAGGGAIYFLATAFGCGLSGNVTVTNDGTIDFLSDAGLASYAGAPQIVNNSGGTIRKSAGSLTSGITVPVTANSGSTLQSSSGTLSFIAGGNFTGITVSGSGIVALAAGSGVSGTTTLTGKLELTGNATLAGTLNASGTLTLDSGVDVTWPNVNLSAAGSRVDGAGTLRVSGNFTWAGGTIAGSGPRVMTSTSAPTINCSVSTCALDGGTLQMQAHSTYSASINALVFSNGGSLILDPGKLFFVTNDGDFTAGSGGGSITIGGFSAGLNAAIEKNTTAGTSVIGVPVTMSGSFKVDAGTLQVAADVTAASGAIVHYSPGATLDLMSGVFLINSSSITFPANGDFKVSGGTLRVPTGISIAPKNVTLQGGVIDGGGTLTLTGTSTWSSGTMGSATAPGGTTQVGSGQTLNVTGAVATLAQGRVLQNDGTLNLTVDGSVNVSGSGTIANNGTLTKNGGSGTTTLNPAVNSTGTVSASTGTLALAGGGTLGGTVVATSPATIAFPSGTYSLPGAIGGTGNVAFNGAAVTVSSAYSIPTFSLTAGTATLDANGTANAFTMTGGTLGGSGTLTLTNGGTWSGGTMSGSGTTINSTTLTVSAPVTLNTRTLQNNATLSVGANVSGSGTIVNQGIFNATANATIGAALNNNGQVSTTNALSLAGGGVHSGSFNVVAPGTLSFSGGTHSMTGGVISGSGTLSFDGATATVGVPLNAGTLNVTAGTATLNAASAADAFTLSGGTLDGSGTLTLTNGGTWSGGTMGGSGTTANPATKTFSISAPATLDRTLQNAGTLAVSGDVSGSGTLANAGTLNAAANLILGVAVNNSGQIATSNALTLSGGGTHSGGTFTATAPGSISFSAGTHAMSGGGSVGGTGTIAFSGATATVGVPVNAGTLSVTAGTAALDAAATADAFAMTGGTLGGSGTLTLPNGGTWAGGTMSGSGTTANPATLSVTAPVTLNSRTLQNSGTLTVSGNVAGSGTIDNTGTLTATASVTIGATLNNNGQVGTSSTLTLTGGGTHTGTFTATAPGNLAFAGGTHAMTGGTLGGTGTLTFSGATATVGVPVNAGTLSVTAGTATLNAAASADAFTMNGGTLGGSATLTLPNGGTWAGGTMSGSGTTLNQSTLSVTAPVALTGRTLQNAGTLNVNADIAGNGTINNAGTLNTSSNSSIAPTVNSSGTLYANGPSTVIDFSGGTPSISGSLAGTGKFRFSGAAATVTGAWSGQRIEVAGGSVAFNSDGTFPDLTLSGGTLTGSGNVTVTGPATWSGGTIAGSGALTFDANANVTMPGDVGAATLSRALSNKGTITFAAASNGLLIDGVAITNDGTFDIQSTQPITVSPNTPPFANSGTLKKSAGINLMQFAAPLANSGTVRIETGAIQFSDTYVQSTGSTTVLGGASLQTATLSLNGGTLGGNGTISGTVNSQASVAPGASPGTLTIDGNYVQGPSGSLAIQLAGTSPGTQYDRLIVSGSVTLGGTLNVTAIDGFTPIAGNIFQILTFGSRTSNSTFATMNGLTGAGTVLNPTFSAGDLQLIGGRIQADVAVSVTAPAAVTPGSAFSYTVSVFNGGGSDANGVSVTTVLPPNVTFTGASSGTCSGAPNVVCSLGRLNNQSTATITISVTATGTGAAPVSVFAGASEYDPNTANNTAAATTSIGSTADLRVAVAGPAAALAGAPATYTISVTNDGPDAAANVAVSATASAGLTFSANSGACSGSFPCTIAALAAGESATIVSVWNVAQSATGSVQLAATAASPAVDPNSANNAASATTQIGTCPTIIINAPTEITSGASAEAVATLIGGAAYAWAITNGTIDSGAGTEKITFTAGEAGTATLSVHVTGGGCTLNATFPVSVKARQFCVGTAAPTAPAGDTTTADANVAFGWTAVDGASGYRLWLQQGDAPAQSLGTTLGITLTKIIPAGTHHWYVETLFDGCASHESDRVALTILPATDCNTHESPQLTAPESDAVLSTPTIAFHWNAVPKALQYELWLATAGGVPTLIRTTTDTAYTASVPPGRLQWYVRAVFAGCAATESAHRFFTYTPPPDCTTQRPLLIEPSEGEKVTPGVSFEWSAVPGATKYELYVDGTLAATTTTPHASGLTVSRGERRWRVRAHLAEGCAALDSPDNHFAVVAAPQSCAPLDAPVVTAPGQITSGVQGRIRWTLVGGATAYVVQISGDPRFAAGFTTSSTVTVRQLPFSFKNEGGTPVTRYVRVHAVDTKCAEPTIGPFSLVSAVSVRPPGRNGVALMTEPADVPYTIDVGAELAGQHFTATPTVPWITVTPSSGVVPPGGLTLHAVAHTAGLPAGASTGTVDVTTSATAGSRTALGTSISKAPITVNNVPGIMTAPKSTPPPDALVIPAVANVNGFIVRYQSDVRASNTSAQPMKYALNFVPSGAAGMSDGQKTEMTIEPGATMAVNDIISTWFGGQSSSGTLEIRPLTETDTSTSSAPAEGLEPRITFASSRTFNTTPTGGTFGQYVPAIPYTDFVPKGSTLSLQQIAQSKSVHTNLGLVEGSGEPVSLEVRIFDAAGAKLDAFPVGLKGGEHAQINAVLEAHHIALDDGRIEVEVVDGDGKVTAYASVIDNSVNDPLLVPPVNINAAGHDRWVLPGVGSGDWQTDVRLFNAGSESADLTLTFYPQNRGAAAAKTIALAPGEVRQLDRVLPSLFGIARDTGALHISSAAPARLVATARTYNDTGNGAYGQFIPAVTPEETVAVGSRPLQILQVEESAAYRSNIGFAEVSGKPVTLEVSVFRPDLDEPKTLEVKLQANEFRQIDALLATVGLADTYNGRISVRAVDGEGRATAYLSLVDLQSGDPTYVPGQ
ncbi:MAG TPA: hypothetical protein VJZ76_09790 [Thermoanaerobaculia bacterium]|nr:hypothetical protein [Thermoanaerobaculia bacterium]